MNCMTEQPDGERIIGVLGWIGIIFLCIIFLPLGLFVLVIALLWKAGSDTHASRYRNEKIREQNERNRMINDQEYEEYKRNRDATG